MPFADDDESLAHDLRRRINDLVRARVLSEQRDPGGAAYGFKIENESFSVYEFLKHLLHVWN